MRRIEFQETDTTLIEEIFDRSQYGHLAIIDGGYPRALPLNFVRHQQHLYFHGSPKGMLVKQLGQPVSFTAQDMASWIPSTWRHPHNACPATTFYRSASANAPLEEVRESEIKARVLEAFMSKYQPEGGHKKIDATDKAYAGPLESLAVARLSLESAVAKVKAGQHLTHEKRKLVYDGLQQRGRPEDRWMALEMKRVDPLLQEAKKGTLRWLDDPRQIPLDQLTTLLNGTYWASDRCSHEIARHLRESLLTLAALDGERLLAYARVATLGQLGGPSHQGGNPGRNVAHLFDVVVHPQERGRGLGRQLMERVMSHPSLKRVGRVLLDTRDAMPLYRKFGFLDIVRTDRNGGSTTMIGGPGVGQVLEKAHWKSVDSIIPGR